MIDQWEPTDVRAVPLLLARQSRRPAVRRMAMLKPFFEYCVSNKWIDEQSGAGGQEPEGPRDVGTARTSKSFPSPTTRSSACMRRARNTAGHTGTNGPARMLPTSSRCRSIPDCEFPTWRCFTSTACNPTAKSVVRTTKAGTHVYTWVPQWLQDRIRERGAETWPAHLRRTYDQEP